MNYLAHVFLADTSAGHLVGGLLGDFARGVDVAALPREVRAGLLAHRRIDRFVDAHPAFRRTARRLAPRYGRYAPVVADVLHDHALARRWSRWTTEPLEAFARRVYETLAEHQPHLGERLGAAWPRMREIDLLTSYRDADGIATALSRLARRARAGSPLATRPDEVTALRPRVDDDFDALFPDVLAFARRTSPARTRRGGRAPAPPVSAH